jgi:hypothetical protein
MSLAERANQAKMGGAAKPLQQHQQMPPQQNQMYRQKFDPNILPNKNYQEKQRMLNEQSRNVHNKTE